MLDASEILALDLSLTASGWAKGPVSGVLRPPDSVGLSVRRLIWIRERVLEATAGVRLAVIEGYAFSQANRAHGIGELGGVVRVALYEAGVRQIIIPPTTLKQYAVGTGAAKKDQMLAECVRRLGYQGHAHDEADALWLQQMAFDAYQIPGAIELPAKQRAVMEKIAWPKEAKGDASSAS